MLLCKSVARRFACIIAGLSAFSSHSVPVKSNVFWTILDRYRNLTNNKARQSPLAYNKKLRHCM